MSINILDAINFQVDTNSLLETFHINAESDVARQLAALAHTASQIGKPKAVYKEAVIEAKGHDYIIVDGIKLTSQILRTNLESTQKIYPYVLTCGRELADWADTLDDMLAAFWADKIMEMALETAVTAFEGHLETHYNPGSISNMNPGSLEDWPISQQKKLFSILGDPLNKIGVQLTDSYLMLPLKSLSGVRFHSSIEFVNCQLCSRENCPNRRVEYHYNAAENYNLKNKK